MYREQMPELYQLCAAYFGQDWHDDYPTVEAAINGYLQTVPASRQQKASEQIDQLLQAGLDETTLSSVVTEDLNCAYDYEADGKTAIQWLQWLQDKIKAHHATNK